MRVNSRNIGCTGVAPIHPGARRDKEGEIKGTKATRLTFVKSAPLIKIKNRGSEPRFRHTPIHYHPIYVYTYTFARLTFSNPVFKKKEKK